MSNKDNDTLGCILLVGAFVFGLIVGGFAVAVISALLHL